MCNTTNATTEPKKVYVTQAPPPLPAIATVFFFILLAAARFPSLESIDQVATVDLFKRRLFPHLVSLEALILIRFAFFAFIACISIHVTVFAKGWEMRPNYLPASKLRKNIIQMRGIRTQLPYTSVTWNLLGLSFGLSSYIAYMAKNEQDVNQWILRAALLIWETAAPNTLLVSAVVRYAIWPAALKHGSTASCKSWLALVWHNANSAMTLLEAALLGGLPVQRGHESLCMLQALGYAIFSWLYMYQWTPEKGASFIYFFFDTTLGNKTTTIAVCALLGVLLFAHLLFSGATQLLEHSGRGLLPSVLFVVVVFRGVCRFRD